MISQFSRCRFLRRCTLSLSRQVSGVVLSTRGSQTTGVGVVVYGERCCLLPILLLLLALHVAFAPGAAAQAPTANADGSYTVPDAWPLKPSGLDAGDKFRLHRITSMKNAAKKGHASIRPYGNQVSALASVPSVDARTSTGTSATAAEPIYWLNGAKVANHSSDFLNGSWRSYAGTTETGAANSNYLVWIGSNNNGTVYSSGALGSSNPRYGTLADNASPLSDGFGEAETELPLYAMTPVFVVDDLPVITITAGTASTEGEEVTFTFRADGAYGSDLQVKYSVADAAGPSSFLYRSDVRVRHRPMNAGSQISTARMFTTGAAISANDDEPDGKVTITLMEGAGYTIGSPASAAHDVIDNDPTTVTLEGVAKTISEQGTLDFTVKLNRPLVAGEILPVPLKLGGVASVGSDYTVACLTPLPKGVKCAGGTTATATITFTGPSAKQVDLQVQALADNKPETDAESVTIGLGTLGPTSGTKLSGGAKGVDNLADFNIVESTTVSLSFSVESSSVAEAESAVAQFSAFVTNGEVPAGGVVIPFTINSGDAVEGDASRADYGTIPAGISIAASEMSGTANVSIVNDNIDEMRERMRFYVPSLPPGYIFDGGSFDTKSSEVMILDNDATQVSITGGGTITEEDVNSSVTMTVALKRSLTVGPFNSNPEKAIVPVILSTTTGAALPGDTNPLFTVTASGEGITIGSQNTSTPTITFTGSATKTVKTATVTFTATANGDSDTTPETVKATLGNMTNSDMDGGVSAATDNSATLTIADDDAPPPELSVAVVGGASVDEGGSATLRVTRTGDTSSSLSFSATCPEPDGFSGTCAPATSFSAGKASVDITYSVTEDAKDEPNAAASYVLKTGSGYTVSTTASSVSLAVVDNDATEVLFTASTSDLKEGKLRNAHLSLGRQLVEGEKLAVPLTVSGTATRNVDYILFGEFERILEIGETLPGVTWANMYSGQPTVTFTGPTTLAFKLIVVARWDGVVEAGGETLDIGLGLLDKNSGTGLGGGAVGKEMAGPFTIVDSPPIPVSLSVSNGGAATEGGAALTITATLARDLVRDHGSSIIAIPIQVRSTGTTAQAADYAVGLSISINTVEINQSGTTSFTVIDDIIAEGNETVVMELGSPLPLGITPGTTNHVTITITDDDALPELSVAVVGGASVDEGGSATLRVTRTGDTSSSLSFSATCPEPDGFSGTCAPATSFSAGKASVDITYSVTEDAKDEPNADASYVLKTGSGYTVSTTASLVSLAVVDNDATEVLYTASASDLMEGELRVMNLSLGRKLVKGEKLTVPLTVSGTATQNVDYYLLDYALLDGGGQPSVIWANLESAQPTVTFTGPSASAVRLAVGAGWDGVVEAGGETLDIGLGLLDKNSGTGLGGGAVGKEMAGPFTIVDSPPIPVSLSVSNSGAATEGGAALTITATLESANTIPYAGPNVAIPIHVRSTGTTAQAADYAVGSSISIADFNTSGTTSFTVINDVIAEGNETVVMELGSPLPLGITSGTTTHVTITITDDDALPELSVAVVGGASVDEGGSATLRVTRTGATSSSLSFNATCPKPDGFSGTCVPATSFSAGKASVDITYSVTEDAKDEPNAAASYVLKTGSGYTVSTTANSVSLAVVDNDATEVLYTASASDLMEGELRVMNLSLGRKLVKGEKLTVPLTVSGTATQNVDYALLDYALLDGGGQPSVIWANLESAQPTVTFTGPSASAVRLAVGAAWDGVVEAGGETLDIGLGLLDKNSGTGLGGGAVGKEMAGPFTIVDSPPIPVSLSVSNGGAATEEGAALTITATLESANTIPYAGPNVAIPIHVRSTGTTAQAADYAVGSSISIADFNASGTTSFTVINDVIAEGNETVVMELGSPLPLGITSGTTTHVTITITDDDQTPTVSLVMTPTTIGESGAGNASTVTAMLSGLLSAPVTVTVATAPGANTTATDYTVTANKVLKIAAGETVSTGVVTITAVDNAVDAPNKAVTVSGTASGGGAGNPTNMTLTITDDEDIPTMSLVLTPTTIAESGAGNASTVMAMLSGLSSAPITVMVSTAPGANTTTTDYTVTANVALEIAAGETASTGVVTITAVDNAVDDPNKAVTVLGTASGGGVGNPTTMTLTITDDEGIPTVSLVLAPTTMAESGAGNASTVTAVLSGPLTGPVTVTVATAPGANTATTDYTVTTNKMLEIAAGETVSTGVVRITAVDNAVDAPNKAVTVSGTASGGGVGNPTTMTLTIIDDEVIPMVSLVLAPTTIAESGPGTVSMVTAMLSAPSSAPVTVIVATAPGANTSTTDYTVTANKVLEIAAGATLSTGVVRITAVDNVVDAPNKVVTVSGTASGGGVGNPTTMTLTIIDDEAVSWTVGVSPASIAENGGTSMVTVSTNGATFATNQMIILALTGTATKGVDYTIGAESLTLTAGQTSVSTTVTGVDDNLDDDGETIIVTARVGGSTLRAAQAVTIIEIPAPPVVPTVSVSASPNPVNEGQSVTVSARLSTVLSGNVTIPLTLTPGVAESGDYGSLAGITITGGALAGTGTITTTDDADLDDETFTVALGSLPPGVTAGSPSSVEVTISDTDQAPTVPTVSLSASPNPVNEGQFVTVTARLSAVLSGSVTIPLRLTPATAESGDYGSLGGIMIPGGALAGTGTITTTGDADYDHETFTVALDNLPSEVTEGSPSSVTVIISDDDERPIDPPMLVLASCEPCTVPKRGEVILTATATYSGGDPMTFEWSATGGSFVGSVNNPIAQWIAPDEIGKVTMLVTVSSGLGIEATASFKVDVINRSPAFGLDVYNFRLAENLDGRRQPVELGPVTAEDPDGEAVTYQMVAGDGTRFAIGVVDGVATYIGPGEDFETVPHRYELKVRASDASSGDAEARIVVTVTGVNERPVAKDDAVETPEDREVMVDVLANDSDVDGDGLRIASVSEASNGTVSVGSEGGVTYMPESDWNGTDRFTYVISDGDGLTAEAAVEVKVLSVNDEPLAEDDVAETPEDMSVTVNVLANDRDEDGDGLRIASVSEASNGTVRVASEGGVTYTPASDWNGTDRFTYVVSDGGGLMAEAAVEVKVLAINDAPVAEDDVAETPEDMSVTVNVLANDRDKDGDGLRIASASEASNGTVRVASEGGVTYTPESDWNGTDRFTYVVSDGDGLTSEAAVEVKVLPVNDAPVVVGVIPDQALDEGGGAADMDLAPFFGDTDGNVLTYGAESSDLGVVAVSVEGTLLTLTPAVFGSALVMVTAEDAGGLSATQSFQVGVGDRPQRAVIENMLAATVRSHLASLQMALGRRVAADACEPSRLSVAGRRVPLGREAPSAALNQLVEGVRMMPTAVLGLGSGDGGTMDPTAQQGTLRGQDQMVNGGWSRLAQAFGLGRSGGTDFSLSWGAENECAGMGRRWSFWGHGDAQNFEGAPTADGYDSDYDGGLRTGYVGIDLRLDGHWLAGLALARSGSTGDWQAGTSDGRLMQRMTALHPYVRWGNGSTSLWATVGAGRGDAENLRTAGQLGTSATQLRLGLVKAQRSFGSPRGLEISLTGDASWAAFRTDDGQETVDTHDISVNQIRIGVDLSLPRRVGDGAELTPFGTLYARHDGGEGQTGNGIEIAGGLRASRGMVRLDAQARILALHSAAGYRESGAALTLTVGKAEGDGLSFSLAPLWGDAATATGSLLRGRLEGHSRNSLSIQEDAWTLDARANYGISLAGSHRLDIFGSYSPALGVPGFGVRLGVNGRSHGGGGR